MVILHSQNFWKGFWGGMPILLTSRLFTGVHTGSNSLRHLCLTFEALKVSAPEFLHFGVNKGSAKPFIRYLKSKNSGNA
jgi:hypothetical protein